MAQQRVYVAGHRGMVGAALVRALKLGGNCEIVTRTHAELDLIDQTQVRAFFATERIDKVYLAAARVGGIHANNTYPANFIYENLMIQANIIHQSWNAGVKRLLFLGSSCIYPRITEQPIRESSLLTGSLEPTNEPYAVAKIAGIKLCESYNRQYGTDYRSVMPTNLYGPGDYYHNEDSHVVPALIRRFHEAKINKASEVIIWGTGLPKREFLYVDDMAEASIYVMGLDKSVYEKYTEPMRSYLNVGTGRDIAIARLADLIKNIVGYEGRLIFDADKPDGTPKKLLDISNLSRIGWTAKTDLKSGLAKTYRAFENDFVSNL